MDHRAMFFQAPDDGGAGGGSADDAADDAAAAATGEGDGDKGKKTYTQEELNGILTRKSAESTAALLKELGVESTGKLKDDLKALREIRDKNKTEAEKAAELAKSSEAARTAAEAERDAVRLENAALKAGVSADKVDRFVKIAAAYEGEDAASRAAAALKDFPEFKAGASAGPGNLGGKSKDQGGDPKAAMAAKLAAAVGVKAS